MTRGGRRATRRAVEPVGDSLRIVIPSQTSFLGLVRELAERVAHLCAFDTSTARRVALAVDEATTNSIKHGYRGAGEHEVEVRFAETARELVIEVIDEGRAIDRKEIPRVDLDRYVSERRTGGLGVHLMNRIMDAVAIRRVAGRNVCRMRKRKPGRHGGEP